MANWCKVRYSMSAKIQLALKLKYTNQSEERLIALMLSPNHILSTLNTGSLVHCYMNSTSNILKCGNLELQLILTINMCVTAMQYIYVSLNVCYKQFTQCSISQDNASWQAIKHARLMYECMSIYLCTNAHTVIHVLNIICAT